MWWQKPQAGSLSGIDRNFIFWIMNISRNKSFPAIAGSMAVLVSLLMTVQGAYAGTVKTDDDGHVLIKDWKEYGEAVEKDLPQTQADVLERIIGKSERKGLSWDFYDAVRKYRDAVRAFDWKRFNAETGTLGKRIADYGDLVVTWNFSDTYPRLAEIPAVEEIAGETGLKDRHNSRFYTEDRYIRDSRLPEGIAAGISNDYEYLLWSALMRWYLYAPSRSAGTDSGNFDLAAGTLSSYYTGRYPEAAYLEFLGIMRTHADSAGLKRKGLEAFADKYSGKAVRLFAEQELIRMDFDRMEAEGADAGEYAALRSRCTDFEKARKAMKEEASLTGFCTYPAELIKRMDFSRIRAEVIDDTDTLRIALQNLPEVNVEIRTEDSTLVYSSSLQNRAGSYYVPDTLQLALPVIDDGNYRIICRSGDVETSFRYERYTISMAWQIQDKGLAVYLADFRSGRPVEKADVQIYYRDSLIRVLPDISFDGFTLIDASLPEEADRIYLQCLYDSSDGISRKTGKEYVWLRDIRQDTSPAETLSAVLLTDRAAFNPGDTLKFKAVLYEIWKDRTAAGWARTRYKVCDGNTMAVTELVDATGKTVSADTLTTNGYGSVAGSFRLPDARMNGRFTLCVKSDDRVLASTAVTVDEFVLPTFTASFEQSDKIYFTGDTVTVKGRIKSYAGQSLAAASVTYRVSLWNEVKYEGELYPASDGTFSIDFAAGDGDGDSGYLYYKVEVKVTDATGETHEFSDGVVIDDFHLDIEVENKADATVTRSAAQRNDTGASGVAYDICAVEGDFAVLSFVLKNAGYDPVPGEKISYDIYCGDSLVTSGEAVTGDKVWIDLSSWPSATYRIKASVEIEGRTGACVCDIVKTAESDESLYSPYENFFKVLQSDDIRFQFGAAAGPVWAVIQIVGDHGKCLLSEMVHLSGVCGEKGSLMTLSYDFKDEYPDNVLIKILYFRNGNAYTFEHDFIRRNSGLALPLAFSRFVDKAYPGTICHYEIQTLPGVECAVSVFDMTTGTIRANIWNRVLPYSVTPYIYGSYSSGTISGRGGSLWFTALKSASPRLNKTDAATDAFGNAVIEESSSVTGAVQPDVREDFTEVLAFYPFLRSDGNGRISFDFTAGDKLSTYYVSLFAHDKSMNNNVLRKEMMVTLPVSVSVVPPAYLYSGDRYDLQVALSNVSENDSEGTLSMYLYGGSDHEETSPLLVSSHPARIESGAAVSDLFSIEVPEDADTLGIKVIYSASDGVSDGLFVTIPVSAPVQTLYESHSSLLLAGMSRDSLYNALMEQFVNVSGHGAVSDEISIADMLGEAIPEKIRTSSPDVISVTAASLSSLLTHRMRHETAECDSCTLLMEELLSYQNAGGGFAWLRGGQTSPVVTAVVLEYISIMERKNLIQEDSPLSAAARKAVAYLDRYYFSGDRLALWAGDLDFRQYLYIRSVYNSIPLSADPGRKELKAFTKRVRNYLNAKDADQSGLIHFKARRAITLLEFLSDGNASGNTFFSSINLKANGRLSSSLDRYMSSMKEYAVDHRSGGKYFPNAVMPFRGLLENELYAHSVLCRLFTDYSLFAGDAEASGIADGIRLWIMVQKETQSWDDDPAYLLALDAVMDGSPELLASKVLVLTKKYMKPFREIKPAGNGISVKCRYLVEDPAGDGNAEFPGFREIGIGDTLRVGDKVLAVYELWSEENRSFVRFSAPRYASMRPENQLSGYYGVQVRPRPGVSSVRYFTPYSYREVKADRSIWYMDVLAEENTILTETMIVTQSGVFSSPVTEVECMYAPHYRANDACHAQLVVSSPLSRQ